MQTFNFRNTNLFNFSMSGRITVEIGGIGLGDFLIFNGEEKKVFSTLIEEGLKVSRSLFCSRSWDFVLLWLLVCSWCAGLPSTRLIFWSRSSGILEVLGLKEVSALEVSCALFCPRPWDFVLLWLLMSSSLGAGNLSPHSVFFFSTFLRTRSTISDSSLSPLGLLKEGET